MSERDGYLVLARKYRPATFEDLIGQEPMVRTLKNAFNAGRVPHAWMLTGVRGVGKTTTARILARALNFERDDGSGEPTVDLSDEGVHGSAILEGRHPDVIEMDAASNTGVDNIRDLIESAQYAPTSARYKVFIVDEVHMLSRGAFNALLKTLEEPPSHVKFVFATTEIRKVPVTILSRCQRFDLRRVEAETLIGHLAMIAGREEIAADRDALAMIARAAEGSVRDALSILDQAIAHGGGKVETGTVRDMLGIADRARVVDLFAAVMNGATGDALALLSEQHASGADPLTVLSDLADFTHYVTRLKLAPEDAARAAVSEDERERGGELAGALSLRVLSRTWQILLKGLNEVQSAPRPIAAADMVLVRLCHSADLPTPDEALRMLVDDGGTLSPPRTRGPAAPDRRAESVAAAEPPPPEPVRPRLQSFNDVVALARQKRNVRLANQLERQMRPVGFEPPRIEVFLLPDAEPELSQALAKFLMDETGERWFVTLTEAEGSGRTLHEERRASEQAMREEAERDPLVEAVMKQFPGAEIVKVREAPAASDSDDIHQPDKEARR